MNTKAFIFGSLCLLFVGAAFVQIHVPIASKSVQSAVISEAGKARVVESYGKLPLSFEANRGQSGSQVKFLSRGNGYSLFLTATEAVLSLKPSRDREGATTQSHLHDRLGPLASARGSERLFRLTGRNPEIAKVSKRDDLLAPETSRDEPGSPAHSDALGWREGAVTPVTDDTAILHMKLVGANPSAPITGLDELPGKSNYFIGNEPSKWRTNVPNYAKVKYKDVYPGVDLVYYGNQRQLEYDLVVAPGADPNVIRLAIQSRDSNGAVPLRIDGQGDLVLETGAEKERVRLHRPVVYQEVNGDRHKISGSYIQMARQEIGFQVAAYDTTRPLVIDPVLVYSTYLGGGDDDEGYGIAVDSSGNAYIAGSTASANFPTKTPLQATSGGFTDAFVAKLNPSGSALLYSTYLGGSNNDIAQAIAVDSSGNAYVTGGTNSTNFPTVGAVQASNHGDYDVFVARLNANGSALGYSTYLGGGGTDVGYGIAVDSAGNAYVTGFTGSVAFPVVNGVQLSAPGNYDAFVTKLNPSGSQLAYSTYLGGSDYDQGSGIAVDSIGNAYVIGFTSSTNFPTQNPLQRSLVPGTCGTAPNTFTCPDVFVTKLNPAGTALIYSTYLGGGGDDEGYGIALDSSGNAYLTGSTSSTNFPTASPFQAANGGSYDVFVSKLNASGSALVYSTYLGGGGGDSGASIAIDSSGDAYITGNTGSNAFPTFNPLQARTGAFNAFVTKLNPAGSALIYSTYMGGSVGDSGAAIALDSSGNAYVTGTTFSSDFTTASPFQSSLGGGTCGTAPNTVPCPDAFVFKITDANPVPSIATLTPSSIASGGAAFTLGVTGARFISGSVVSWNGSNRSTTFVSSTRVTAAITAADILTAGTAQVTVLNPAPGGGASNALAFTISTVVVNNPVPTLTSISPTSAAAGGPAFTLTLNGSNFISSSQVLWNTGNQTTTFVSGTQLTAAIPASDIATAGTAQVTVFNPGPGGGSPAALTFTISGSSTPVVPANSVVNNASFATGTNPLAPGTIAAIFGTNLDDGSSNAFSSFGSNGKLLTILGGASVTFNGISAPIFSSFPGQLNIQIPVELAGNASASVVVTVGGQPSASQTVPLGSFSPGIFSTTQNGAGQGAIQIANTTIFAAPVGSISGVQTRPASRGEFITIYCTGLGAVTNQPASGVKASDNPLSATTTTPSVTIGGMPAPATDGFFSGLAPGFVGLYQINVQVPQNAPTGDAVQLMINIGGATSNTVTIAVQ